LDLPDVVYLCGPDVGRELKYSLRSLRNLPHDRVWIAGYQPKGLTNVERLPVRQRPKQKWENQEANLRAYCDQRDGTDRFVLFNDDFYVMSPLDTVPVWHRGPIGTVVKGYGLRTDEFVRRLKTTAAHLGDDASCYDSIHTPMLLEKSKLLTVLDELPKQALFRTWYGNRWKIGGQVHGDVKVKKHREPHDAPLLSTSDASFKYGSAGELVRATFRTRSPYEC
jgi:hypothetical protein